MRDQMNMIMEDSTVGKLLERKVKRKKSQKQRRNIMLV
jgi:hypothetical protein